MGKLTPLQVDYRTAVIRSDGKNCHNCSHRVDRGELLSTCTVMEGTVDPQHICDYWHA